MNSLGNYPEPHRFLPSLTNVTFFCAELINDFDVSFYHHQAFDCMMISRRLINLPLKRLRRFVMRNILCSEEKQPSQNTFFFPIMGICFFSCTQENMCELKGACQHI